MTKPQDDERAIEGYVARLKTGLAGLPRAERKRIAEEIRSHLEDRAASGGLKEAMEGFGPPERLASSFVEDYRETRPAPGVWRRTLVAVLKVLARIVAIVALWPVAGILFFVASIAGLVLIVHFFGPDDLILATNKAGQIQLDTQPLQPGFTVQPDWKLVVWSLGIFIFSLASAIWIVVATVKQYVFPPRTAVGRMAVMALLWFVAAYLFYFAYLNIETVAVQLFDPAFGTVIEIDGAWEYADASAPLPPGAVRTTAWDVLPLSIGQFVVFFALGSLIFVWSARRFLLRPYIRPMFDAARVRRREKLNAS